MVTLSDLNLEDSEDLRNLEELLAEHELRELTPEEMREQRISFVMGMLPRDSTMTRDRVRAILEKVYG